MSTCAGLYVVLKGQCLSIVCDAGCLRPASVLGLCMQVFFHSPNTFLCHQLPGQERELYSKPGSCPRLCKLVWQRLAGAPASPVDLCSCVSGACACGYPGEGGAAVTSTAHGATRVWVRDSLKRHSPPRLCLQPFLRSDLLTQQQKAVIRGKMCR